MTGLLGPRLYLIGTNPYLAGTDLYLLGTNLYLVGTNLYLIGTRLYLIARIFTSKALIFTSIFEVKSLAQKSRHGSLPREVKFWAHRAEGYDPKFFFQFFQNFLI